MREYILVYINGREHRVRQDQVFLPLSDYLRRQSALCGTKVVCAEGDCGACTVAIGKLENGKIAYVPVNSCIQYMFQLDCRHVITVEGVSGPEGLNPVQKAMVDCHGAQCGYCTPGFIVALSSLFDCQQEVSRPLVKEVLSGNLCRCTGYLSIIEAALSVDVSCFTSFNQRYQPEPLIEAFCQHERQAVRIECDGKVVCLPATVEEAVTFKQEFAAATVVSGGTDLCVNMNKRGLAPAHILSLSALKGLDRISSDGTTLEVGAKVTLWTLERYVKELIPEFYKTLFLFGSPQIRYAGTLAGNIANASPIADSLPFLYVMAAEVEVAGGKGVRRIKISALYRGYKTLALEPDELITRIFIPLPDKADLLKLYKVSKREHLDIASFNAAFRLAVDNETICSASIAYGGVGPMIIPMRKTEQFLLHKPFTLATFVAAGAVAQDEITPISDVRGSSDFRYQLAQNILLKFFHECAQERQMACR